MADGAAEGVHRLKDILVEEVSLVDRPANKRRFLLVKREGGEMSELRSNGRGGFTRVTKSDDEETEKKGKPFPGAAKPFGKPGEKPAPAADDADEETKAKAKKAADDYEEEEKARKALDSAGVSVEAVKRIFANDTETKRRKSATAIAVAGLASDLFKLADDMDDEEEDEPSDANTKKCADLHKSMGEIALRLLSKRGSSTVAKIGAKMAATRLASFKEAMGTLQSILTDLLETPAKAAGHEADAGDPQKAAAGFKANNPSGVPTNAMGQAAVKSLEATVMSAIDEIVTPLLELSKAQGVELAKLKKGIVPSNTMVVEKRGAAAPAEAWPMDMNARGRVTKSGEKIDSFLDD